MNKEVTIIAVKEPRERSCYGCIYRDKMAENIGNGAARCVYDDCMVIAGLPSCLDGYIYKIKEDGNESISDT